MRARDLVGQVPIVEMDLPVLDAARILADQCLPGLIVVDDAGCPVAVLPGVEVLRLVVPAYVEDSAVIAQVIDEAHADVFPEEVSYRTVGQCLPYRGLEPSVVSADATVVEIAALMVGSYCPLVAVVDQSVNLLGVVTLESLLKRMFAT
ncbi:CBS domain-containing protein [Pseudonocardia sp. DLS-67]